jgi:hypothetical protein
MPRKKREPDGRESAFGIGEIIRFSMHWKKFFATHSGDAPRAYLGRVGDGSVGLRLKDKQGRDRILLRVNPDGAPVLQLLDAGGKVTAQLPPTGDPH